MKKIGSFLNKSSGARIGDLVVPPPNTQGEWFYQGKYQSNQTLLLTDYKLKKDKAKGWFLENPTHSRDRFYIADNVIKTLEPSNYNHRKW